MAIDRPEQRARAEAELRYAGLRRQGYEGWIDRDGHAVDLERWLVENRPGVAALPTSVSGADQRAELVERMMAADPGADRPALAELVDDMPSAQVAERLGDYAAEASTPSCAAEFDATVAPAVEARRVSLGPFGMARELDPVEVDLRDRAILDGSAVSATAGLAGRVEALAELAAADAGPVEVAGVARSMVDVAGRAVVETEGLAARAGERVVSDLSDLEVTRDAIARYDAYAEALRQVAVEHPERAAAMEAAASCMNNFGVAAVAVDREPRARPSGLSSGASVAPRVSNAKRLRAPVPRSRRR